MKNRPSWGENFLNIHGIKSPESFEIKILMKVGYDKDEQHSKILYTYPSQNWYKEL